jgi:outer membrane protein OmpA-like peptidoglycan-associated protein
MDGRGKMIHSKIVRNCGTIILDAFLKYKYLLELLLCSDCSHICYFCSASKKQLIMRTYFLPLFVLSTAICFAQTTLQPTDYDALVIYKVTDDKGVPEQGAVVKVESVVDKSVKIDTTDIEGNAELLLKKGSSHKVTVEKSTFKFDFGVFDIPRHDGKFTMEENLQIKVITKYNRIYELKIHFAPNKADLYEAAKVEVNKLADEMIKNPAMKIEIAGHTDNVGDDKLNMQISQKRANAIKTYLIEKGVSEKRIIAKGYGETVPVADNNTEEGRTRNRRIEIRLL